MIVAHVMGIPIEESILQLVPAAAAFGALVAVAASRLRAPRVVRFRRGGRAARD
jgi:hypothetical protein